MTAPPMTNSGRDVQTRSAESDQRGTREMVTECSSRHRPPSSLLIRFREQEGKCFYCGLSAWMPAEGRVKAARRLGLPISGDGWRKNISRRMATREHLRRRADGGPDHLDNYVMAHRWCNKVRGETTVHDHKSQMLSRLLDGTHKLVTDVQLSTHPSADMNSALYESSLNPSSLNQPEPHNE